VSAYEHDGSAGAMAQAEVLRRRQGEARDLGHVAEEIAGVSSHHCHSDCIPSAARRAGVNTITTRGPRVPSDAARPAWDSTPGTRARGGPPMRMPRREEHMTPRRYQTARVQVHWPAVDTHTRSLLLEQTTVYADGWAR
jgi:hypothetical protein